MSSGSVLVTGAAGFVGSHLLELLARDGTTLVGWSRPGTTPQCSPPGVHWMDVELQDAGAVRAAIREVKPAAVYHLAGAAHVAQSWNTAYDTYAGNVLATHHLLEAVRAEALTPRVLLAGSAMVYAPQSRPLREDDEIRPASPYATSKLAQEMLGRRATIEDGVPALLARSFNHTGPRHDPSYVGPSVARQIALIEAGRAEPVLHVGNLEPKRDLSDVRDTVRAYAALMAAGRPGVPYNVCSGRAIAIGSLIEMLTSRARVAVRIVQDSELFRPNDHPVMVGDHSRLTADTGWSPQVPFERTVDDLLEFWRARVRDEA